MQKKAIYISYVLPPAFTHLATDFAYCQLLLKSKIVNRHSAICFYVTDLSSHTRRDDSYPQLLLPTLRSGFGYADFQFATLNLFSLHALLQHAYRLLDACPVLL